VERHYERLNVERAAPDFCARVRSGRADSLTNQEPCGASEIRPSGRPVGRLTLAFCALVRDARQPRLSGLTAAHGGEEDRKALVHGLLFGEERSGGGLLGPLQREACAGKCVEVDSEATVVLPDPPDTFRVGRSPEPLLEIVVHEATEPPLVIGEGRPVLALGESSHGGW